ncbi:hypothetical protein VB620_11105 [Nodularia harveyana UHCC-0300]|uniref:Bacteriocin-type signal sequence n=1 Tax=Nodularia harveyana UHCC-0300 TaxID=2974287 RepID=A0ABU5UED1_9CYAN|nr:hypothetical protein [Nodularia harveyana]MEA5581885.1 hypothetical protein [Nodularia harveyana UHCC-0300]
MKEKQQKLKNIDLFTELTLSQQEQINGGIFGRLTFNIPRIPNGSSTPFLSNIPIPPPPPPPPPEEPTPIFFFGRFFNFIAR